MKTFIIRREETSPRATQFEVKAESFDEAVEKIENGEATQIPYWDSDTEPDYTYTDETNK